MKMKKRKRKMKSWKSSSWIWYNFIVLRHLMTICYQACMFNILFMLMTKFWLVPIWPKSPMTKVHTSWEKQPCLPSDFQFHCFYSYQYFIARDKIKRTSKDYQFPMIMTHTQFYKLWMHDVGASIAVGKVKTQLACFRHFRQLQLWTS